MDINELQKQNQQLHSTLGKMDLVFGAIDESIIWTDVAGKLEWCNDAFIKLIQAERINVLGKSIMELLPIQMLGSDQPLPLSERPIGKAVAEKSHYTNIYVYQRGDSQYIVELSAYYMHYAPSEPCVIVLIRDITQKKMLEAQQLLQEERLEQVMNATQDGFWDEDLRHNQVFLSDRLKEMLGYDPKEKDLEKQAWLENLIHPEDKERVCNLIKTHIQEGAPYAAECRLHKKNDDYQWFLIRGKALYDEAKKPTRVLGTLIDISARKEVEQMKNEFISTVSHELRTPITSIMGALGLLTSGAMGTVPKPMLALLEIASNNSARLVRLINDILDTEKMEAGKMVFNFDKANLTTLLEQAIVANKPYADKYQVMYKFTVPIPDVMVSMDSDRIRQVIDNLLSNAAKFSKPGGVISVAMSRENGYVRVSVIDTGAGIPEKFQARIFSKFYQADSSDVREKGGTGLGLSICKKIIEFHNGSIGFKSVPNVGTTFYFDLLELVSEAEEPTLLRASSDKGKRILVCEDDPDVSKLLGLILRERGFSSTRVSTLAEAKKALSTEKFSLMTLDLILPDGNGLELLKWMRTKPELEKLPVVVISAVSIEDEKIKGSAFGIVDWISKPINEEQLYKDVAIALGVQHNKMKSRALHVEDDPDIAKVVSAILSNIVDTDVSPTISHAKKLLNTYKYHVIILDLNVKDGSGYDMISYLEENGFNIPVVILSVDEAEVDISKNIVASLVKSRVSNTDLLEKIVSVLEKDQKSEE